MPGSDTVRRAIYIGGQRDAAAEAGIATPARRLVEQVPTVYGFLQARSVPYRRVWRGAHTLSGDRVAKNLLLVDGARHALALVTQGRRIDIEAINRDFLRGFRLGGLGDVNRLFPGMPPQALWPACIDARVELFVDEAFDRLDEVALETHDQRCLVLVDGDDFRRIFRKGRRGRISAAF